MMADSDQSRGSFVNENALAFLVKETIRKSFFLKQQLTWKENIKKQKQKKKPLDRGR